MVEDNDMSIQELEIKMWNAAKSRDSQAFLEVVDENAVMVCGGFRCSGADYADLEGVFHITSTWKKVLDKWKLIFNMDSRIIKS